MEWISRLAHRAGTLGGAFGSVIAAASCPACFPALAGLGAAAGVGFLSEYEGLFITTLLPLFAGIALVANALGWLRHRQWWRSALGMIGPALVLAAMLLFFGRWWTARLLYTGLALMVAVSLWDLVSKSRPRCSDAACTPKSAGGTR
jgi:mercuric ion transport protein